MRQLASRKIMACRRHTFRSLITSLAQRGLKDPLTAKPNEIITLSTNFETTLGYAFSESLAERFNAEQSSRDFRDMYAEPLCFGCDVHTRRMTQWKVDVKENRSSY